MDGKKDKWTYLFVNFILSDQLFSLSTARDAGREAIHHLGETVTQRPGTVGSAEHLRQQQQQQLIHLQQHQQQQQQQTYAGVLRSQAQAGEARQSDLDPIARIRNLGTKGSHFSSALM